MVGPGGNRNNYQRQDTRAAYNNRQPQSAQPQPQPVPAEKLPAEYVDQAEAVMLSLRTTDKHGNLKFNITASKIRKILTLVTDILNEERFNKNAELNQANIQRLSMARVRIAYDAGGDNGVKEVAEKAKLLNYIKGIGKSRAEFIRFAEYMEALVAWHRYLGGEN